MAIDMKQINELLQKQTGTKYFEGHPEGKVITYLGCVDNVEIKSNRDGVPTCYITFSVDSSTDNYVEPETTLTHTMKLQGEFLNRLVDFKKFLVGMTGGDPAGDLDSQVKNLKWSPKLAASLIGTRARVVDTPRISEKTGKSFSNLVWYKEEE